MSLLLILCVLLNNAKAAFVDDMLCPVSGYFDTIEDGRYRYMQQYFDATLRDSLNCSNSGAKAFGRDHYPHIPIFSNCTLDLCPFHHQNIIDADIFPKYDTALFCKLHEQNSNQDQYNKATYNIIVFGGSMTCGADVEDDCACKYFDKRCKPRDTYDSCGW